MNKWQKAGSILLRVWDVLKEIVSTIVLGAFIVLLLYLAYGINELLKAEKEVGSVRVVNHAADPVNFRVSNHRADPVKVEVVDRVYQTLIDRVYIKEDLAPPKTDLMGKFLLDGITLEEAEEKANYVLQNLNELLRLRNFIESGATLEEARLSNFELTETSEESESTEEPELTMPAKHHSEIHSYS